tara:strand:- start:40378 stop:40689 length:312 start_codon:yes stop_codon:yes gene_type:complete
MVSTEFIGLVGTFLMILAYIPQVRHTFKEHCTGGVSVRAWLVWLVATSFIFVHAITTKDIVFITLQAINFLAIVLILILIKIYGRRVCHSKESLMKKGKKKKK